MEDRFMQQLKKGVLEMLVLNLICSCPSYGYELLMRLKEKSGGRFALKEGTLYPILYRMEDEGLIASRWSEGSGRNAPKKMYEATEAGRQEKDRRIGVWQDFVECVNGLTPGGTENGSV